MRAVLPLFFFVLGTLTLFAQPANDNCSGAVSLPFSSTCVTNVFSNIGATASNIGSGNNPNCFNGGTTQRDVWFTFTTPANTRQATITVKGVGNGPNAVAIKNPQIAVYRGTCGGLSQIECFSAPNGSSEAKLEALNLTPNVTYYVRVNDYAATATPNSGDFNICVQPYVPAINLGQASTSTSCSGTLYDSGGPNGNYGILENYNFSICPTDPHACIEINLEEYDIEPALFGFFGDLLTFHAGNSPTAPIIAQVEGQDNGTGFKIQASTPCILVHFESDFLANYAGFKLTWQCSSTPCNNHSIDNPTSIGSLPFLESASTCESASTFSDSPCASDDFLNGPEYVYTYNAPGNTCIAVNLTGAAEGTGIVILDGNPNSDSTNCVARNTTGNIKAANLLKAGTYYIVVANATGCTPFNISVEETTCAISPALVNALCNPLNGCVRLDGLPSVFDFEHGFQDMQIVKDVNNGCWLGYGVEPNFYWFTIQAQADGRFGFILNSANPDTLSDLDFNVWGPFTQDQVCGNPQQTIDYIRTHQPIRSSWSPTSGPTGLTDVHPFLGYPITDNYDCGRDASDAGADGDDYVSTIKTKKGEVYVVLINDWEDLIGDDGVSIDWSPSDPPVLEQLPAEVLAGDTAVCRGDSVQILIKSPISTIKWLNDTQTLSCTDCPNPVAKPLQTTTYRALVEAVCYKDTISVTVQVFGLDAGPDITVCRGEKFEFIAGEEFPNGTYSWTVPANIELSCTDCPNPIISAPNPGTYPLIVTLTAPGCTSKDTVNIIVRAETAPVFTIQDDMAVCAGTTVDLGAAATAGVSYSWTSRPAGFTSTESNPQVTPTQTTTYILRATNTSCPLATVDSVTVTVYQKPNIQTLADTTICQESPLQLSSSIAESGVTYEWVGPDTIVNPARPNTLAYPTVSGTYILTASRGDGACVVMDTVNVNVKPIDIEIQTEDTVQLCRGNSIGAKLNIVPAGSSVIFASTNGLFRDTITTDSITLSPDRQTTYIATVNANGCSRYDTLTVIVDSLPSNLAIMPGDTSVCQGSLVLLTSEIYEPKDFPNIDFMWVPSNGQQTPDSLYNMVISADTTTRYYRITTSGVCVDSAYADITVKPIPQIEIIPADTTVCAGQSVRLTTKSTPSDLEKPKWDPMTGLSCVECFQTTATVFASSNYSFKAEKDGCPGSASATIRVLPSPVVQLNPKNTICLGESIQLNFASTPGASYRWTSSTNPNFSSTNPLLVVSPTQTTTYTLQAQTSSCALPNRDITITVLPIPSATIQGDTLICDDEEFTLTAKGNAPSGVAETFIWTNVQTNQTYSGSPVTIDFSDSIEVALIYSFGGCISDIVSIKAIKLNCAIQIPNAFTPNGDGKNDYFNIITGGSVEILEFKVFNRWGQLVYNNSNPAQGWDGKQNGRDAPSDVYVYYVRVRYLNGEEEVKRGNVTLIR